MNPILVLVICLVLVALGHHMSSGNGEILSAIVKDTIYNGNAETCVVELTEEPRKGNRHLGEHIMIDGGCDESIGALVDIENSNSGSVWRLK